MRLVLAVYALAPGVILGVAARRTGAATQAGAAG